MERNPHVVKYWWHKVTTQHEEIVQLIKTDQRAFKNTFKKKKTVQLEA